ncbi:DUF3592 domain-containing protein [Neptuniibacter halophilus]|uniref:DUF3592 domain-containing protein n=1 Tax=Neptuniibacter halophilus TaxID=651666 RepID=UPI0025741705|nr:DUF3592 domain-containing protein [Neptuniibacter halophilus]
MYLYEIFQKALAGDHQALFFCIAAYGCLACAVSVVLQLRMQRWKAVDGQLLQAGAVKVGHENLATEQHYMAEALYVYQVAGREYRGSKVSSWVMSASGSLRGVSLLQLKGIKHKADGSIVVYHHPDKPEKSMLIRPGRFSILLTAGLGTLPVVLYLLRYTG